MSQKFTIPKLTPLPDNVLTILNIGEDKETKGKLPAQIKLPQVNNPLNPAPQLETPEPHQIKLPNVIMSPLPPLNPMVPLVPLPQINTTQNINPAAVHNPVKINQYTQELQMVPLSPRSPRVKITSPPVVVTHQVEPTQTETCCICYDEEIPTHNLLTCKHPVCGDCVKELNKPECPMCKEFLSGPLVTDTVLADIMNRQEQARLNEITANYLAGVYLEEHPEADPEEVYERYKN